MNDIMRPGGARLSGIRHLIGQPNLMLINQSTRDVAVPSGSIAKPVGS
jgi:hypothetical protein